MLILISDKFDNSLPGALARYGEVTDDKNRVAEADIILVRSKTKANKEYLDAAKNLKLIIRGGVGMDNIDAAYAIKNGVIVKNTAEASTVAVAELAFALMIALPNNITKSDASMREGKWLKAELERSELHGKTLAILGMGRIGTALAIRARAFRMNILAWHPDVYFSDFATIVQHIEDAVSQADYISMHIPSLPETRGIVNKKLLAQFKTGAYLINTGRAETVVDEDVVEALKSGKLAGFATDVWYSDPPVDSPLANAPNTIFTPHLGASSRENMLRIGEMVEKIIAEFVKEKR
ncbi:MAG: NAD(P)-binding domain-containing protein [candidate division Zixibacteria bacterium]|nr:NAD(P)-binding domain-containing protein [candidate division Zixibacteria bacterium]